MSAAALLALAASAALHASLMFREGRWLSSGVTPTRLAFCLASMAVYAAAAAAVRRAPGARSAARAAAVCASGLGVVLWSLYVTRGDQRGLVFVFVPALQWGAFAASAVLTEKKNPPEGGF